MADIELVIKISEASYAALMEIKDALQRMQGFEKFIVNGVPLPKGHGRLGDLDALEKEMTNGINAGNYEEGYETFAHINNMDDCVECVKYADTIIEADKKSEEE